MVQLQQASGAAGRGREIATNALNRLKGAKITLWWFIAACCVFGAGLIGTLDLVFTTFEPIDVVDEMYLCMFGGIMMVLDAPVPMKQIQEVQGFISKYAMFLTRLVGRGMWYTFLGTMTFATLAENSISIFLAVVLGFYVVLVGLISTVYGLVKSRKLERVRYKLFQCAKSKELGNLYERFAKTDQERGLTTQEFNNLASQVTELNFDKDELACIFNALAMSDGKDDGLISLEDLNEWCSTGMAYL